jgi:hypothetical protein
MRDNSFMTKKTAIICLALTPLTLLTASAPSPAAASATQYTVPNEIRWIPQTLKGANKAYFRADLRGTESDKCGQLIRYKLPDGFFAPWHVNNQYGIYTILQGTLILGFDRQHRASAERRFPAGSVIQGLATEPHYGRFIGETIFDYYVPCGVASHGSP